MLLDFRLAVIFAEDREVKLQIEKMRHERWLLVINGFVACARIVCYSVPILASYWVIDTLAGEETIVITGIIGDEVSLIKEFFKAIIYIGLTLSVTVVVVSQRIKLQRNENVRLRERNHQLENLIVRKPLLEEDKKPE